MIIVTIEKKKGLYLITLDNAEELCVTEDTIVRYILTKGTVLDENSISEIKRFSQISYGKNLALSFLSFKSRTCQEVMAYLTKKEIEEAVISDIVIQLKKDKWLDDANYARQVFEKNAISGHKGAFLLKQNMIQKGIERQLLDALMEEFDFYPVACRVAEKLFRHYNGKYAYKQLEQKMLQSLIAKGFSHSEAKQAFDSLAIERDEDIEWDVITKELDKQYPKYARKYEGHALQQRLIQYLVRKGFSYDTVKTALREYL